MLPLRLATPFLWCIAPGGSAQRGRRAFACAVARGIAGVAGGMDAGGIHDMYKVVAQDKGSERRLVTRYSKLDTAIQQTRYSNTANSIQQSLFTRYSKAFSLDTAFLLVKEW